MHFFPRKLGPAALNLNLETVIPKTTRLDPNPMTVNPEPQPQTANPCEKVEDARLKPDPKPEKSQVISCIFAERCCKLAG